MYDKTHFTRDKATVTFDSDAPGVAVDDDGEPHFDWDEVETVTVKDPPHAEAFDSKEFYKLPATVARPIPQPYQYGEDVLWLKKPREELKKAAWSLENAPWTMDHPDTGMVKDVSDIRGFWGNPRYIDSLDDLDADLHVPVGDDEAREYIEENGDVSVGFYNRTSRVDEYDGVVGGEDAEGVDIDGYQTDMYFDHVASVSHGRCPGSKGCGIDGQKHGHMDAIEPEAFISGTGITKGSDGSKGMPEGTQDAGREVDGTWHAVPPEDTSGDEPKFPIESCSDVQDAWQLRGHAEGLKIDQSTLENRIQSRAESLDCEVPGEDQDSLEALETALDRYSIMTKDCDCGGDKDTETMQIDFDDLSTEAAMAKLRSAHDGADERLAELEEAEEAAEVAEEAADELDLDSVEDLADKVALLEERKDELEEKVDELQRPEMEEDAEFIAERTDRFGEDAEEVIENLDADPEKVADKRELVEELTEDYEEQTANPGGDDGGSDPEATTDSGRYVRTPWGDN